MRTQVECATYSTIALSLLGSRHTVPQHQSPGVSAKLTGGRKDPHEALGGFHFCCRPMLQAHKQIEVYITEPRRQQRLRNQFKALHLSASDAWLNYLAQEIKEDVSRC